MKQIVTIHLMLLFCLTSYAGSKASDGADGNLPVARQARIKEVVSPNEIDLYAVGIAGGSKSRRLENAKQDAYKSAVYYLLYSGSDPILSTEMERLKFQPNEQGFFERENIAKYVVYESPDLIQRLEIDQRKRLKIEKVIRINIKRLKDDLIAVGVLEPTSYIVEELGYPSIMVLPDGDLGSSAVDSTDSDSQMKHGASVIESFLTARHFDVTVPEQSIKIASDIYESNDDQQHTEALSYGSDVYIVFSQTIDQRPLAGRIVSKASVAVRAYETSTARLLGTETGYSKERPDPETVVIEEAVKDAIDKVLSRIESYWKEDRKRGIQYKLMITIGGQFSNAQQLRFTNTIAEFLDGSCNHIKENAISDKVLDFIVWAKPEQYENSRKLSNALIVWMKDSFPAGELVSVQINHKLIHLELKNGG